MLIQSKFMNIRREKCFIINHIFVIFIILFPFVVLINVHLFFIFSTKYPKREIPLSKTLKLHDSLCDKGFLESSAKIIVNVCLFSFSRTYESSRTFEL